ncbi:hypothetical protein Tco_0116656 [Tanacetum coccineum]
MEEANHEIEVAHMDNNPFVEFPIPEPSSEEYSTQVVIPNHVYSINQPPEHINKWTKDHPIDNVIGDPFRLVSTRQQLHDEALFYVNDGKTIILSWTVNYTKSQRHLFKSIQICSRISKKYGMETCEPTDTPMVEKSKLDEDPQGKSVDPTPFISVWQSVPGTINMGLWYSKDSCIALTTFADADHAGCQDSRKEQVENGVVELYFIRTEYELADIYTKPLARERLEFLIKKLRMQGMSPETLKKLADEEEE